MIPNNILKEHILKAIEEIDSNGIPKENASTAYDLVFNDKLYPPKLVVSLANKYANGEQLNHNTFSGGIGTPAFNLLKKFDFIIKEKSVNTMSEFEKQAILDLMEISQEIVNNGLVKKKIFVGTPEHDIYTNIIKAKKEDFTSKYGSSPNQYIKKILQNYFSHARFDERYSIKTFDYWGRVLRPYIWGCIYLKTNKKSTPASYSPQLYIFIDKEKLRFGFYYGDHIKDSSPFVQGVLNNRTMMNGMENTIMGPGKINLYRVEKGDDTNTRDLDTLVDIKQINFYEEWSKDYHLSAVLEKRDISNEVYDDITKSFDYLKEPFEEICDFGNNLKPDQSANKTKKYWLFSPGKNAEEWSNFYDKGIMAIGWDDIGDLSQFESKESIVEALKESFDGDGTDFKNNSLCCYEFANEINIGDVVICKEGRHTYLGYGIVSSNYEYDTSRDHYRHVRKVNWIKKGNWHDDNASAIKTLTNITKYPDSVSRIKELLGMNSENSDYNIQDATSELFLSTNDFKEYLNLLKVKKNIVLQGPPGVGKTFLSKRLAYCLLGKKDDSKLKMIQFHQSYSYEDFIQGFRPVGKGGFELTNGIFYNLCEEAKNKPDSDYVLIIDEINRGNLSKIFGELLMLIESDKRGQNLALTYSPTKDFHVPANLYLIGTMNTADRSIAMVDYALRRRFSFISLAPQFNDKYKDFLRTAGYKKGFCNKIITAINSLNEEIKADKNNLGEGYQIGHSYFCPDGSDTYDKEWFNKKIKYDIEPLLKEYWFDEPEKIESLIDKLILT